MHTGITKLGPVKIDITLTVLFEHETVLGLSQLELGTDVPFGHRMRLFVNKGAMHGIHHVVDHVTVVSSPLRVAKEITPLRIGELLGEHQRRRFVDRQLAVVEPYRTVNFFNVKRASGFCTLQSATRACRYFGHQAITSNLNAMIGTGQSIP